MTNLPLSLTLFSLALIIWDTGLGCTMTFLREDTSTRSFRRSCSSCEAFLGHDLSECLALPPTQQSEHVSGEILLPLYRYFAFPPPRRGCTELAAQRLALHLPKLGFRVLS